MSLGAASAQTKLLIATTVAKAESDVAVNFMGPDLTT
jgi:hypothetical protein